MKHDLVTLLLQGPGIWNEWREKNKTSVNLIGANLRAANLLGTNLRRANLMGADLRESTLIGADLFSAYLVVANFSEATLGRAGARQDARESCGVAATARFRAFRGYLARAKTRLKSYTFAWIGAVVKLESRRLLSFRKTAFWSALKRREAKRRSFPCTTSWRAHLTL